MRSILLSVISMLTGLTLYAQDCDAILIGDVVDFHDGDPLVGAVVIAIGTDKQAVTDFYGKFTIDGVCNGKLSLQVSHPLCKTIIKEVMIEGNSYTEIRLEHHLEELGEVVVTGESLDTETRTAQEAVLKTETIEKYSAGNLGQALKEVSGVSSLSTGSTIVKPVIQGLHSSRIIIMNNGTRLQDQEWGIDHAPNIDVNTAGRISVIKGAAALQYGGDAVGGTIVVEPGRINMNDSIYGKTILTGASNGRGGGLTSQITKSYDNGWFVNLQGTLNRYGDFRSPDYYLTNTGFYEKNFSIRTGLNKFTYGFSANYSYFDNKIGILRASHIGNLQDLERAINSDQPLRIDPFSYDINAPRQRVIHRLFKLDFFKRFSGLGKLELQYDYQQNNRLEFDIRRGDDSNKPSIDLELTTHTFMADLDFDSGRNVHMKTGILLRYQENFPDPDTGVRRLIPDYEKYEAGVYLTGLWNLSSDLLLEAGGRYDFVRMDALKFYETSRWNQQNYQSDFAGIIIEDLGDQLLTNPVFDYHNLAASAGARYHFSNEGQLSLNYTLSQRAPNPSELFSDGLHHSNATIELGDLRIDQEVSHKVSLTVEKNIGKLSFSVAPYLNYINDYIFLEPTGAEQTIRGAFPVWSYKQTNARFLGVDLDAAYSFNEHWSLSNKTAFLKAKDVGQNRALIDIPAVNTSTTLSFTKRSWKDLSINLTSDYVFRQNEFPDNNFTIEVIENGSLVEKEVDISTPPDAYHLLGIDARTRFELGNNSDLTLGLIATNLFDTNYRDYLNRLRYYADDLGRNVQLQIKFTY
ncbi:TonB-dependent receptor [Robertkochia aurantiaca]|uniref:TonB-dependent receptor n=1 Tax=Robertkochia aurantiaca TaxID=2873700 RepID=UPI001CC9B9BE|nr:TonB-dependent receptor [Robertkochia sp. 3YJGBD-33]